MDDNTHDDAPDPAKTRHTVSFTHRQVGITASIAAALLTFNPKEMFSRHEAEAQGQRIEKLESAVNLLNSEITHKLERNADKIIDRIKDAEERTVKNQDRLENRIERLEALRLKSGFGNKVTN